MLDIEQKHRVRFIAVFVRAIHLTACAVILGGAYVNCAFADIKIFIYLCVASGLLLWLTELLRHPGLFRELSGWFILLKLILLLMAGIIHSLALPLLFAAFFLSCIGSHMPKQWRAKLLF